MKVDTYKPKYKEAFVRLNTEWLTRFYWIESYDQYAMDHVEELIEQGAMAFFALDDKEEVIATCMVMPLEGATWEICKLAARNQYTGTGAGSAVLLAAINYAEQHGARKEVLISCRGLKPAIHLYQKFGFHEVPYRKEFWKSGKADIEMERCL